MTIDQRKSIIFHVVHRGCYVNQLQQNDEDDVSEEKKESDKEKDEMNRNGFKWIADKLDGLVELIDDVTDSLSNL